MLQGLVNRNKAATTPTKPTTTTPSALTRAPGHDLSKGYELGPETYRDLVRNPYLNVNQDKVGEYFAANPNLQRTGTDRDSLEYQLYLAKQFDPDAKIIEATEQSSDGYTEGFNPGTPAFVQYDKTKAPKPVAGNGEFVLADQGTNTYRNDAVVYDPNYGWITSNANVKANNNPMWQVAAATPAIAATLMGAPAVAGLLMSGIKTGGTVASGGAINPFQIASLGTKLIGGR